MASVAALSVPPTKETSNYSRLCRLLVDVATCVLREMFDTLRPPGALPEVLVRSPIFSTLQSLRKKKILNASQWGKLFPAIKHSVSSKEFDMTLLMVLLRHICNLKPPVTGWYSLPPPTDVSCEADIVRIKNYRSTIYGHANASVDDITYAAYWHDIRNTLFRLGGRHYEQTIDRIEKQPMCPEYEEHIQDLLRHSLKDEENIKDKLDELEEILGRKLEDFKVSVASRSGLEGKYTTSEHTML